MQRRRRWGPFCPGERGEGGTRCLLSEWPRVGVLPVDVACVRMRSVQAASSAGVDKRIVRC